MDSMSCLQTYFESQDDREAAALVADMIALLPSKYIDSTSAIMDNDGDSHMDTHSMEKQPFYQQTECDDAREVVNNNQQQYLCMLEHALLAKESEIAMLKETALEWKHRAEANAQNYSDHLEMIKKTHQSDLRKLELRYTRNLDTKNDIILSLKEQIDYLSDRLNHDHQTSRDIDFIAAENREGEDMINANRNRQSVTVQRHRMNEEVKFDTLLGNLNDLVSEMEQDLLRAQTIQQQRVHSFDTQSTSTHPSLIQQMTGASLTTRNSTAHKRVHKQKPAFFFKRVFKKAFPTFCDNNNSSKKPNLDYTKTYQTATANDIPSSDDVDDDSIPRSSTDETLLGSYATTSSTAKKSTSFCPPHIMNILPSLNQQILR